MDFGALIWSAINALGKTLGSALGTYLSRYFPAANRDSFSVTLITDITSEQVHAALAMFARRLPEYVRFPSNDVVRWLAEDQSRRQQGLKGPRHYFLIASFNGRPCGCTLIHSFREHHLAFIAYLVSDNKVPCPHPVDSILFKEFKRLRDKEEELRDCSGAAGSD